MNDKENLTTIDINEDGTRYFSVCDAMGEDLCTILNDDGRHMCEVLNQRPESCEGCLIGEMINRLGEFEHGSLEE